MSSADDSVEDEEDEVSVKGPGGGGGEVHLLTCIVQKIRLEGDSGGFIC